MLKNEKWQKAKEIFQAAMDLPPAARKYLIEKESRGDDLIKTEVETLLEAYDEAGGFIIEPVAAVSEIFENEQKHSIIGKEIGAYKILEEIGRGGMGAVSLAERADAEFKKRVAVKLIKRGLDTDEVVHRFRNERQILANLERRKPLTRMHRAPKKDSAFRSLAYCDRRGLFGGMLSANRKNRPGCNITGSQLQNLARKTRGKP